MIIKSINKNIKKYGFPEEMEYSNPDFNGHQVGIIICIQNNDTKEIEKNYLPENLGDEATRDFLLGELLHEKKAILITEEIVQYEDEGEKDVVSLIPKTVYYMPYYIDDHSRFKPTIINENVSGACNVSYEYEVEVLFATGEDGLCRYLTIPFKTRNIPVINSVYSLFNFDSDLKDVGFKHNEDEDSYSLDFYNEAGHRVDLTFEEPKEFRDLIVSMRVISMTCKIDDEE